MTEIGALLRKKREEKGLSYKDIQDAIKIRVHYLEALESGNFDVIPGEVYLKGFLTSYATFLGIGRQEILSMYHNLRREQFALEEEDDSQNREAIDYFTHNIKKYPYKLKVYLTIAVVIIAIIGVSIMYIYRPSKNAHGDKPVKDFIMEGKEALYSNPVDIQPGQNNGNLVPTVSPSVTPKSLPLKKITVPGGVAKPEHNEPETKPAPAQPEQIKNPLPTEQFVEPEDKETAEIKNNDLPLDEGIEKETREVSVEIPAENN